MKPEELNSNEIDIQTEDGWIIKVNEFKPPENSSTPKTVSKSGAKAIAIVLPAMGAHSRPYRFMASELARAGNIVFTADPRGHGKSLPHPKRGIDYGFDDFLSQDIPAIVDHARRNHPDLPVFLIGHSLGGHLSAAFAAENPAKIAGVITLTCSHLYYKILSPPSITIFAAFALMAKLFGYVPGQYVGWGSPMARQQVLDWANWGFNGKFQGTDGRQFGPLMKAMNIPSLCIGFTDDKYLGRARAVLEFAKMFADEKVTHWSLSPQELDTHSLGHFDHLRTGGKLWTRIDSWISAQL